MAKGWKILITGAGGFLGACAVYYFEKAGYEVFAGVRSPGKAWRLEETGAKQIGLDITSKESVDAALAGILPKAIINFAAYGAYPGREGDAALMKKTNVGGAKNLLDAAKRCGAKKFVQIGTSSESGAKDKPVCEEDECTPDSEYGKTKLEATGLAIGANSKVMQTVVIRPFSPFGYWEDGKRLVPTLILSALDGKSPKLSSPYSKRDFMFVDDLNRAIAIALTKDGVGGEIFNISMGKQMSVGEMAKLVNEIMPKSPEPEWGSIENPRKEPQMWQAGISKAKKMLGWAPELSVKEGLEKTIEWFRAHKKFYEGKNLQD